MESKAKRSVALVATKFRYATLWTPFLAV